MCDEKSVVHGTGVSFSRACFIRRCFVFARRGFESRTAASLASVFKTLGMSLFCRLWFAVGVASDMFHDKIAHLRQYCVSVGPKVLALGLHEKVSRELKRERARANGSCETRGALCRLFCYVYF